MSIEPSRFGDYAGWLAEWLAGRVAVWSSREPLCTLSVFVYGSRVVVTRLLPGYCVFGSYAMDDWIVGWLDGWMVE
jgi:hypothetical protein